MAFEPYPAHVHKAGGVFAVVQSDAERDAKLAAGWYRTPLEAEQALSMGSVGSEPVMGDATPATPAPLTPRKRRTH